MDADTRAELARPRTHELPEDAGLDSFLGQIPIFLFSLIGGSSPTEWTAGLCWWARKSFRCRVHSCLRPCSRWGRSTSRTFSHCHLLSGSPRLLAARPTWPSYRLGYLPTQLQNAVALNSIQFNLARVIGPMLGGLALKNYGAAWCFGLNGISYMAPIIALLFLPIRQVTKAGVSMVSSLKEGLNFVSKREGLPALIVIAFCMTAFGVPLLVYIPVVVRDVFHGGPEMFTSMLVVSGVGAIVGAIIVAAFGSVPDKGRIALLTLAMLGILIAGFGLSRSLSFSFILMFFGGLALMATFAMISSLVQLSWAMRCEGGL